jgi:hypothetical protein
VVSKQFISYCVRSITKQNKAKRKRKKMIIIVSSVHLPGDTMIVVDALDNDSSSVSASVYVDCSRSRRKCVY